MFLIQFCTYVMVLILLVYKRVSNSNSIWTALFDIIKFLSYRSTRTIEPEIGNEADDIIPNLPPKETISDDEIYRDMVRISEMNCDDIVHVAGLHKSFQTVKKENWWSSTETTTHKVLDNLWFCVRKNECFGFLGPNGAGKSLTIKTLLGLRQVDSGYARIGVFGVVPKYSLHARSVVGVCPQFDVLWDSLTPLEHIYLFAALKGCDSNQCKPFVDELLLLTGLEPFAGKYAKELSGGTRRKISLIGAVLGNPQVLFLDGIYH
jgi:ABC-type Na+ transport system ATPase subunit NatA